MLKRILVSYLLMLIFISLNSKQLPDFKQIVQKQKEAAEIKRAFYSQYIESLSEDLRTMDNYDVKYYDLEVEIDFEEQHIIAQNFIRAEILEDLTSEIELHFTVDLNVIEIQQNYGMLEFTHEEDIITITIDDQYNMGDVVEITIQYEGFPQNRLNDGMKFQEHNGIPVVFTMVSPMGARKWWPCKDTPADKPDSLNISITYPDEYICASNGTLVSQVNNGNDTITDHWFEAYPVATYLTSFAITNYEMYSFNWNYEGYQMPVDNYTYPEQSAISTALYGLSSDMLTFFSDVYGLYPFIEEKYGHATCTNLGALAMEHQTCTSFDAGYISDEAAEYTVAHELAHQWAGDCLSIGSWSDVWLKEGFASYSEALWAEHLFGEEALHEYMLAEDGGSQLDECLYRDPNGSGNHIFNWVVYAKGSWVLHMLRGILGDDTFFQLMNDYMQNPDFQYGNVITEDLKNFAGNYHSNMDTFFDEWFYNYGRPRYKYAVYTSVEEDSIRVMLHSEGSSGNPFSMYVPYKINDEFTGSFWAEDGFNYYVDMLFEDLETFELDPDNWVLDYGYDQQIPVLEGIELRRDGSVVLVWEEFFDPEIVGFNVYRKLTGEEYEQLNSLPVVGTSYFDESVEPENEYFYKVAAVFQVEGNYISQFSNEILTQPVNFTFDEGIFLVDGTRNNTSPFPSDLEVDNFYTQMLNGYQITIWDVIESGLPPLTEMAKYSSVIWHTDDILTYPFNEELYNIKSYLLAGGNLLISSWKNLHSFNDNFQEEYLNLSGAATNDAADFSGAFGELDFPDISVDSEKILIPYWNGNLMFANKFVALDEASVIYGYDSDLDDPEWENMPCAQKYENGYKVYIFGFPLYFIEQNSAQQIFVNILEDFGEETSSDNYELPITNHKLSNYPNPFNPSTTISFELNSKNTEVTELLIYNVKGQKVKILECINFFDAKARNSLSHHSVSWNGKDEDGKSVSSGIYFYNLIVDKKVIAKSKMLLIK